MQTADGWVWEELLENMMYLWHMLELETGKTILLMQAKFGSK